MHKSLKIILLVVLILTPIIFYKILNQKDSGYQSILPFGNKQKIVDKPAIALIFDDFGESLYDLREVYSLGIPLTISILPNLKFSKNIAHIAYRCDFSVFVHLPMESKEKDYKLGYKFISSDLSKREIKILLRNYLNSIRIAIGVNNHMGSQATESLELMQLVLEEIKKYGLIFVDSRTSSKSVAYEQAQKLGLISGYNEGFLDYSDNLTDIGKRMEELIKKAQAQGKIIVIAHPRKNTIDFLKKNLPSILEKVRFITIKDYFEL
ncbi:MAG: divergent polysaccharide deacetylase family protein [Candidatus Omnitrophica bacterium]|jgi:polysaccharide deacetylase 2 family uncharacterized protein YibQ|nr:divergent polysaccharide deacetylase family protein [Candidatus Omnitrophota bacterium]